MMRRSVDLPHPDGPISETNSPFAIVRSIPRRAIVNFSQYYSIEPQELWATNIIAAILGIVFFLVVVLVERLVVHRPPEQHA